MAGVTAARTASVRSPGYVTSLRAAVAALRVRRAMTSGWSARQFSSAAGAGSVRTSAAGSRVLTVPLVEVWASGARSWSSARRAAFAQDDARTMRAVTAAAARARGSRDPASWLPASGRCRYVADWTAVKLGWGLSVDPREAVALRRVAAGCPVIKLTVTRR